MTTDATGAGASARMEHSNGMREPTTLRPAMADEQARLSALAFRSKAHWGYPPGFMAACRAELTACAAPAGNPSRTCVVAESHGAIVGFYTLERRAESEQELEALFVEPAWIGKGIGRRLIEHAKAHARRSGARSILIQGDPHAARFYEAAGATRVGERESASIPGRFLPEYRIQLR